MPERQISGAAQAARHLLSAGLAPVFDQTTLDAMSRAGHRDLVTELRRAS